MVLIWTKRFKRRETVMDYKRATRNIRRELTDYIEKNKIQSLVIGVSGGIDSALCCALAEPVCNKLGIPLIGRSLPMKGNKQDEKDRAKKIGEYFCTDFYEISLFNFLFHAQREVEGGIVDDNMETKIRNGNIQARLRMIYLYDLAQKHKGMVLSTDNYTEYLLGFWTLHGDVGDYGMIQNLWKTEVYALANWIAQNELQGGKKYDDGGGRYDYLMDCIEAVPTDGLGITDSDLDQLGADTYEKVDNILKAYIAGSKGLEKNPVVQRMLRTQYKRNNPYNIPRIDLMK